MYGRISDDADAVNRFSNIEQEQRYSFHPHIEVRDMYMPKKLRDLLEAARVNHVLLLSFQVVQDSFKVNGGTLTCDVRKLDEYMEFHGWFRDDVTKSWIHRDRPLQKQ